MTRIAYLGTGLLGAAFVEAALARGEQVTVWNRTAAKAAPLEALGATVAATPAEAVKGAERIHLVLSDDAAVNGVLARLMPGLSPGAVIVDHTTNLPAMTAHRAARLAGEGTAYLHCPVFIGPVAARTARGVMLASGPADLFDRVEAGLRAMAERVEYLGPRPDLAAAYKLCGNAYIIGATALVGDVLRVGQGGGIEPLDVLRVFDFFNAGAVPLARGRAIASGNVTPTFELTMALKDVRLMRETAAPRQTLLLPVIAARMEELIAGGAGAADLAAIGAD